MAVASPIVMISGTTPATPATGKASLYFDSSDGGKPKYLDDAGVVHSLVGATGPTGPSGPAGNSLARPLNASLTSTAGAAVIDLSLGKEVYYITLTENTTISFTNLPASGYVAEVRVRITQHASAAKTCAFSGTSVKTAGGAWTVSSTLSSVEDISVAIDSAGNITIYPSGVLV